MAFAFLTARWRQGATRVMFLACAAGLIADGWLTALPTEEAPRLWTSLRDSSPDATPVLELPLGPDWDFAAIFHATMQQRSAGLSAALTCDAMAKSVTAATYPLARIGDAQEAFLQKAHIGKIVLEIGCD